MDIRIGTPPTVADSKQKSEPGHRMIEARLLSVATDPLGARVLLLMVRDASQLPDDLAPESHRVFLRFAKR